MSPEVQSVHGSGLCVLQDSCKTVACSSLIMCNCITAPHCCAGAVPPAGDTFEQEMEKIAQVASAVAAVNAGPMSDEALYEYNHRMAWVQVRLPRSVLLLL